MANVKETYLKRELADAGREIAKANEAAGKANEAAGKANEAAGKAIAHAALLQEVANESSRQLDVERRALLQLQLRVSPRTLGPDQQEALADAVRRFAGKIVKVQSYAQDAEAALLGQQITAGLEAGGVVVQDGLASIMPLGGFVMGIAVSGSDQSLASLIANTLGSSGMVVGIDTRPPAVSSPADPSAPPTPIASILVGVKPVARIAPANSR